MKELNSVLEYVSWLSLIQKKQSLIEAVVQRCSVKKVFLESSQNSQESTGAKVSFLIKLQA